jgi:hypothetical protein
MMHYFTKVFTAGNIEKRYKKTFQIQFQFQLLITNT